MRVGAVNLRSGGNAVSVVALADRMIANGCSVIVFSEYRDNAVGKLLLEHLKQRGYEYFGFTNDVRGVLVVSKMGFDTTFNPGELTIFPHALLRADFASFAIYGVYLPTGARKIPHFDFLIKVAHCHNDNDDAVLAIGDFNNGCDKVDIEVNARRGKLLDSFPAHSRFHTLDGLWPESWRHFHPGTLEYSWYASNKPISQKRGWRLDHAFVSPALLPRVCAVEYDHSSRIQGLTDHSALIVDLG